MNITYPVVHTVYNIH